MHLKGMIANSHGKFFFRSGMHTETGTYFWPLPLLMVRFLLAHPSLRAQPWGLQLFARFWLLRWANTHRTALAGFRSACFALYSSSDSVDFPFFFFFKLCYAFKRTFVMFLVFCIWKAVLLSSSYIACNRTPQGEKCANKHLISSPRSPTEAFRDPHAPEDELIRQWSSYPC